MKRLIFIFTLVMIASISVHGQSVPSSLSIKYWDQGPLTLDDFTIRTLPASKTGNSVIGIYTYIDGWKKIRPNFRVQQLQSRTYFDPLGSWLKNDTNLLRSLKYQQLLFDVAELDRRKMQNDFATLPYLADFSTADRYLPVINNHQEDIEFDTDMGTNEERVTQYEQQVHSALDSITEINTTPQYTLRNLGYGFYLGAASQFHIGKGASYFTPTAGALLGCLISYKASEIHMDLILGGGGKLLKDIQGNKDPWWTHGRALTYGELTLQYAYRAYDGNWFNISPLVGLGVGFIDYKDQPSTIKDEISGLRMIAGVNIDLKLMRSLRYPDTFNESILKLKLYASHTFYQHNFNVYTINASLSYLLFGRKIKREP